MWPALIEDGAVLQTGIGGIPDAVLPFLMDRKDLGVHSELVSDGVIPLIEAGRDHGRAQELQAAQDRCWLRAGDQEDVRFVDNNPIFEFHPNAYTNDPAFIGRNDNMVAINSALADRSDRTGLRGFDRQPLLQRHRRAGGLPARRVPLQGRQADHRSSLDG